MEKGIFDEFYGLSIGAFNRSHRHILNLGLCGGGRAVDSGKRGDFGVKMLNLGNITGDRWAKKDIHGEF